MVDLLLPVIAYRRSSSGIATFTYELAKALSLKYDVLLPVFGMSERLMGCLRERGVTVLDMGRDPVELGYAGGPIPEYYILSGKLKKALRKLSNFDILMFTIPGFAIGFSEPFITKAWGHQGLLHAMATSLRYLPIQLKFPSIPATIEYWLIDNEIFKRSKYILCTTKSSFRFYSAKFGRKALYIPPPIEEQSIMQECSERLRILFVSRDLSIPRKNLTVLLSALMKSPHLTKIHLTLVGRNFERFGQYLRLLRNRGLEIETLGYVNREYMPRIYANNDILVYPSYYEELGYAVLEAMAHGLAVICSDIPSFRDMVIHGKNGFLIDPGDYETLASYLTILCNNREHLSKMKVESLKIVREKFNPELTVRKLRVILDEFLK